MDTENIDWMQRKMMEVANPYNCSGSLKDAMMDADIFIGVSAPNVLT